MFYVRRVNEIDARLAVRRWTGGYGGPKDRDSHLAVWLSTRLGVRQE